jgi:glycosyltransferase involved in cell wall biosynthesis
VTPDVLRVAVDANSLAWGWSGIPKYVDRIVRELVRQEGIEVTLLANADGPFADLPGARQVHVRRRGGVAWRNSFVLPWLARERPDVFWAPETLAPLLVPVPYVVTVHDLATRILPQTKPWTQRVAYRHTLGRVARRARLVLAVSQTTARDVARFWDVPDDRIRVVPNGVDEGFTPGDRRSASAAVERRHGVTAPYVLAVGALEPRKGLDVLIAAAEGAPWRLVLAGAEGFEGGRIALAAQSVGALVLSRVDDAALVDLYRGAEVLAAPSLYEGFGVTPLEAMASGTPAVVASGSGLEEVSGPAAVVVSERTPGAWRAAIDEARSRREELVARGLRHAARFRWPDVARDVRAALEEAASR